MLFMRVIQGKYQTTRTYELNIISFSDILIDYDIKLFL